jgi:hypothetical protein
MANGRRGKRKASVTVDQLRAALPDHTRVEGDVSDWTFSDTSHLHWHVAQVADFSRRHQDRLITTLHFPTGLEHLARALIKRLAREAFPAEVEQRAIEKYMKAGGSWLIKKCDPKKGTAGLNPNDLEQNFGGFCLVVVKDAARKLTTARGSAALRPDGVTAQYIYDVRNSPELLPEWKALFDASDFWVVRTNMARMTEYNVTGNLPATPLFCALCRAGGVAPPLEVPDAARFLRKWGEFDFPIAEVKRLNFSKRKLAYLKKNTVIDFRAMTRSLSLGEGGTSADLMCMYMIVLWCACYTSWFASHMVRFNVGQMMTRRGWFASKGGRRHYGAVEALQCPECPDTFFTHEAAAQHVVEWHQGPRIKDCRDVVKARSCFIEGKVRSPCWWKGCKYMPIIQRADGNHIFSPFKYNSLQHEERHAVSSALELDNAAYEAHVEGRGADSFVSRLVRRKGANSQGVGLTPENSQVEGSGEGGSGEQGGEAGDEGEFSEWELDEDDPDWCEGVAEDEWTEDEWSEDEGECSEGDGGEGDAEGEGKGGEEECSEEGRDARGLTVDRLVQPRFNDALAAQRLPTLPCSLS